MSPEDLAGQPVWVMAKGYTPDVGGMQTYAEMVAQAYRRAGAQVTVFSQTSAGPREELCDGIRLIDIGPRKGLGVPFRYRAALARERARSGSPAIVHGTTWRTSLVPLSLSLPYFVTFHGREFMQVGRIALALLRKVARSAIATVAVSHYSAGRLSAQLGAGHAKPVVAWNGISLVNPADAPDPTPDSQPLILSLCRLEPRKNILACVRSLAVLRDEGLSFRCAIAGTGPDAAPLADLVAELGLSDRIELLGYVGTEQARRLYRDADIFVHPQIAIDGGRDFEGFGIAIADAMESRTAVIVGQDGGAPELVEDGVSGLVVDGRAQAELTDALRRLLADAPMRAAMGRAAQERARKLFTWDRHIATILASLPPVRSASPLA